MQPLLAPPRDGLLEADVLESLALGRGAQVRHGVDVLGSTDEPTGETQRFISGSVTWSYRPPDPLSGQQAEVSAVRRQASLELAGPLSIDLTNRRLRPWTEMRLRTGAWARWHLGVFVPTIPAVVDDGRVLRRSLSLADKAFIWNSTTLTDPLQVLGTAVAVDWVKADMTARFAETRFAIAGSTGMVGGNGLTFEPGTSLLEVYSRVLATAGYDQLTADENGRPAAQMLSSLAAKGPEVTYGAGLGKVLTAGSVEPLLPSLPNVVRFTARQGPASGGTEGNGIRTVKNQSIGPGSIDSRGFEVPVTVQVDAYDQTTLDAVAAAEKQRYFAGGGLRFTGHVGLNPRHSDRDVIGLSLPRLGINDGSWLVTDWSYPLGDMRDPQSALMSITAERRVV